MNPCEKNFCLCLGVQVPYGRRSSLGDVLNTKEVDERGVSELIATLVLIVVMVILVVSFFSG